MTDLEKQISSAYFEAENSLNKRKGERLQVFVEDEEDVPFWKDIFLLCNVQTRVYPASKTSLKRGKEIVLRLAPQVGKNMVLAVDSDYDYLLGNTFTKSELINTNPYIFQTYVYSIENFKSLAEIQHQIVVESALVDSDEFDYEKYVKTYSELIYELFLYSFFYHRENLQNAEAHKLAYEKNEKILSTAELKQWQTKNKVTPTFTIEEFCKEVELNKFEISKWEEHFEKISKKIDKKLKALPIIEEKKLEKLKQELEAKGVKSTNVYLFAKGHKIYDNIMGLCIKEVHKVVKQEEIQKIKTKAKTPKEGADQMNKYKNQTRDLDTIRQTHKGYHTHFFIEKIKKDIQIFLSL